MADLVTTRTLFNGPRHLVVLFTNLSDATGETGVLKVNASAPANSNSVQGQNFAPGVHLKVTEVDYDVSGMSVELQWVATTNENFLILGPGTDHKDFRDTGGIQNPGTAALAGSTGSIAFTTVGAAAGAHYAIKLTMTKGVPQS